MMAGYRGELTATAVAHPSLALVKYWGKRRRGVNIPATSSVGISLAALTTTTTVSIASRDRVVINDREEDTKPFRPLFSALKRTIARSSVVHTGSTAGASPAKTDNGTISRGDRPALPRRYGFSVTSGNDFPTAAGLASSASGFAALVTAALAAAGASDVSEEERSALARIGSGSAARSIFGGFVVWEAGASAARQIYDERWWPELRVVVLPLSAESKPLSSRSAMNATRDTSPFFRSWVQDAPLLNRQCLYAVAERDLTALGEAMRKSYLRMFATMMAADPPVLYWSSRTVDVLHTVDMMRREGMPVWETMDAGPQVKVIVPETHVSAVLERCEGFCALPPVVSSIGGAARVVS